MKCEIEFAKETCPTCYITWFITREHQGNLQSSGNDFYCPSGHAQSYKGKADAEKNKVASQDSPK